MTAALASAGCSSDPVDLDTPGVSSTEASSETTTTDSNNNDEPPREICRRPRESNHDLGRRMDVRPRVASRHRHDVRTRTPDSNHQRLRRQHERSSHRKVNEAPPTPDGGCGSTGTRPVSRVSAAAPAAASAQRTRHPSASPRARTANPQLSRTGGSASTNSPPTTAPKEAAAAASSPAGSAPAITVSAHPTASRSVL